MSNYDSYFLMKADDAVEYAKEKFRRSSGMQKA